MAPWLAWEPLQRGDSDCEGDLFTQPGCDLAARRTVVVKSSQHFRAELVPLAVPVLSCAAPGAVKADPRTLPDRHIQRPKWPIGA